MKKNKFMKLASGLLVLCLMTTCVIGATLAKYVTSGSGTDTARVAKWGVTVSASGTLFGKAYGENGAETDANSITATSKNVSADTNVVAPGTKNDTGLQLQVAGQPEVAVRVEFTGTLELGDKWVDEGGNYYCPLEITVGDTTFKGTDVAYASADDFEAAVNAKMTYTNDYNANTYNANTNLSTIDTNTLTISWKWAFSSSEENDVKDTYLGNQAAADPANAPKISLTVTATVTQID